MYKVLTAGIGAALICLSAGAQPTTGKGTGQTTPAAAEPVYTYTWEELVELIPDIRDMQVVTKDRKRVRNVNEIPDQAKLCKLERAPTSRIARRRCYSLDEYVERYIRQRQAAADFMNGMDGRAMMGEGGGMAQTGRTGRP